MTEKGSTPALRHRVGDKSATLSASGGKRTLGSRTQQARLMNTRRRQAPRHRCGSPLHTALCFAAPLPDRSPFRDERGHPLPTLQRCNTSITRLIRGNSRSSRTISGIGSPRTISAGRSLGLPVHHIENCSRCNRKREIWPSRAIAAAALIADNSTFREVGPPQCPSEEKGTESREHSAAEWKGFSDSLPKGKGFCEFSDPV